MTPIKIMLSNLPKASSSDCFNSAKKFNKFEELGGLYTVKIIHFFLLIAGSVHITSL